MNITLLYGGRSGEHEVSLLSAASVARHMPSVHALTLIGIDHDGAWYLQPPKVLSDALSGDAPLALVANPSALVAAVPGKGLALLSGKFIPTDIVLPILHGTFGEDGTIQGLLETANLAYAGADVLGSAVGMDKEISKNIWSGAGLPVVPYCVARSGDLDPERLARIQKDAEKSLGYPMFVKPACAGSSVGASKVAGPDGLRAAIESALEWGTKAILEPFVTARELECSVVGNGDPVAFPPGEIVSTHEFYDYEAKYIDPNGAALVIPAPIPNETSAKIMDIAVRAYKAASLSGMARVDFLLDKTNGNVFLNEANTIPGFTHISMFPKMCEAGGLTYPELLERIALLGLERKRSRDAIRFAR